MSLKLEEELCSILENPEKKKLFAHYQIAFDNKFNVVALECNSNRAYFEAVAKGYDNPLTIPLSKLSIMEKEL
jgi:hypothetical protein